MGVLGPLVANGFHCICEWCGTRVFKPEGGLSTIVEDDKSCINYTRIYFASARQHDPT